MRKKLLSIAIATFATLSLSSAALASKTKDVRSPQDFVQLQAFEQERAETETLVALFKRENTLVKATRADGSILMCKPKDCHPHLIDW